MENLTHKALTVSYEMYDCTEETHPLLEKVTEEQPMRFMTDFGMMPLAELENRLKDIASGEDFEFDLLPEQAFGEYFEERVVDLDKQVFCTDGVFDEVHIRKGAIVPLQNEEGERFMAQIKTIGGDKVTIDLNHPLAGRTLRFKGRMLDNHEATQDEIMALLNQMNSHHGGCGGCGGGSCSGNCSGGCGNCGEEGHHCGGCHE